MENNNVFLSLMLKFLAKLFIPVIALESLMAYAIALNMPILLYASIPITLYMVKIMFDVKHIAENVGLFVASGCPKPTPYTEYNIFLHSNILTDGELRLLMEWSRGRSVRELNIHPMILNRLLRKYVKETLTPKQHVTGSQSPVARNMSANGHVNLQQNFP
jgi:hypothetical protein